MLLCKVIMGGSTLNEVVVPTFLASSMACWVSTLVYREVGMAWLELGIIFPGKCHPFRSKSTLPWQLESDVWGYPSWGL